MEAPLATRLAADEGPQGQSGFPVPAADTGPQSAEPRSPRGEQDDWLGQPPSDDSPGLGSREGFGDLEMSNPPATAADLAPAVGAEGPAAGEQDDWLSQGLGCAPCAGLLLSAHFHVGDCHVCGRRLLRPHCSFYLGWGVGEGGMPTSARLLDPQLPEISWHVGMCLRSGLSVSCTKICYFSG